MNKIELLAPAGNYEALQAAVLNGADAVYLGGSHFGARAFANNFDHEQMKEAISYCHIHGVKVYVTMNTLVYEQEMDDALKEVDFLYNADVDALLIQDMGLFYLVHQMYPDLDLHCSTQMHIHNENGTKFMKECGATRVVLARETPLDIIKTCSSLGIETEVFSYGALCVSYSGECLMSAFTKNRSGNRGECAQCCRMKYSLVNKDTNETIDTKGEYLLSPKDLNIIDEIPSLIEAGVSSLKIEGRMKRSEYVALTVRTFREAIDAYYEGKKYTLSKERTEELKLLFNRGFTKGHIFDKKGFDLMNPVRPNHIGIVVGKVIKATNDEITIQLNEDVHQGDGLRILNDKEDVGINANMIYQNGLLVNKGEKGSKIVLKCSDFVKVNADVVKTTDTVVMDKIHSTYLNPRIPLKMKVEVSPNKPFTLILEDDSNHCVSCSSEELAQVPMKAPLEKERILDQVSKLNDTAYYLETIDIHMNPIFISIKAINEIRRKAILKMNEARSTTHARNGIQKYQKPSILESSGHPCIVEIQNKDQYIETPGITYFTTFKNVKSDFIHSKSYLVNEKGIYDEDAEFIASELGAVYGRKNYIADSTLNITNSYALEFFYTHNAKGAIFSYEMGPEEMETTIESFEHRLNFVPLVYALRYGKRDLMNMKACIVNTHVGNGKKENCSLCLKNHYVLRDIKGVEFDLYRDDNCIQHILESNAFISGKIKKVNTYIRFTNETNIECQKILKEDIK